MQVVTTLDKYKFNEGGNFYIRQFRKAYSRKIINTLEIKYYKRLKLSNMRCNKQEKKEDLVVSLTSFPERLNYVHLAIISILNQTVTPSKVVLYLAKEQCEGIELPKTLTDLFDYGLEVRYCDEDLLGHKKYYYAMQEFPDKFIVTFDDDIIYPENTLELLLETYKSFPDCVICARARIVASKKGKLSLYDDWEIVKKKETMVPRFDIMASTGAGTLYPPSCMPAETFDVSKIREFALTADDLWMKFMCANAGIKTVMVNRHSKFPCIIKGSQTVLLCTVNVHGNQNDVVIQKLAKEYPDATARMLDKSCK